MVDESKLLHPSDDKKKRLATALRENLKRRKQQARVRASTENAADAAANDQAHSQDGGETEHSPHGKE